MSLDTALGGMRTLKQWFVWNLRWDAAKGKYDKWPACGDASLPQNWMTYEDAVDALDALPRGSAALGFWMQEGNGLWFLDIDNAASNGAWSPFALELVAPFPGALVEVSSSGRGLHVIGKTRGPMLPHSSRGTHGLELYSHARGICFGLTGEAQGSADTFHDYAVRALIAERFPPIERKESTGPDARWRGSADDDVLIEKMLRARQSAESAFGGKPSLKQLWEGVADKNSEHDMALMSHLAFWTGNDWERMVRLARRSGMVRDKWDTHRTYLADTARKAANSENVYVEPKAPALIVPTHKPAMIRNAADLLRSDFRPVQWALKSILPEGVSILSGDPKTGKSFLVYQACIAIATGKPLWAGRLPEEQGDALYLSLEDNERRLKRRLETLLKGFGGGVVDLSRLHFTTEWPRAEEGVARIAEFLRQHPKCRIVVIDTISAFRDNDPGRKSAYAHDYAVGEMLKPLAKEFSCAIVLVMHNRKQQAADFMQAVSGTQGMTGGVDNVLSLQRARGNLDAALSVDGRDIEEPARLALRSNDGFWSCIGNVADVQRSQERNAVIEAVTRLRGSGTVKQIFEAMGGEIPMTALRMRLSRMVKAGELQNVDGLYVLPASLLPPARP